MKTLLLGLVMAMVVFLGCDPKPGGFISGPGKCHVVFDHTAHIELPSPLTALKSTLVADDNTVYMMTSTCPFFIQAPIHNIPFSVSSIKPFTTHLGPYVLIGDLMENSPTDFSYEQDMQPMGAPLNNNCKVTAAAAGEIEVEDEHANFDGTVELWLEWSVDGPPCLGWHLF